MADDKDDDELLFVTCPRCAHEQPDMGRNVACESCRAAPMPYFDDDGELVAPD